MIFLFSYEAPAIFCVSMSIDRELRENEDSSPLYLRRRIELTHWWKSIDRGSIDTDPATLAGTSRATIQRFWNHNFAPNIIIGWNLKRNEYFHDSKCWIYTPQNTKFIGKQVFYFATVYIGIKFGLFHYNIVYVVFHSRATCLVTCGRTGAALVERWNIGKGYIVRDSERGACTWWLSSFYAVTAFRRWEMTDGKRF